MFSSLCVLLLLGSLVTPNTWAEPAVPETWRDDAELRDVSFVDREFGWAVGDHGTIWHTRNGGEIWRKQDSTVDCQLSAVQFLDHETGFAAGGIAVPFTHRSRAVLLSTVDGGRTWQQQPNLLLPWITDIHFVDSKQGYAVGMSSAIYPTAAWSTHDGGRTWSPIPGVSGEHWSGAAFDQDVGLLFSRRGQRAWMTNHRLTDSGTDLDPFRNRVTGALLNSTIGIAALGRPVIATVGQHDWHASDRAPASEDFEVRTMAAKDRHCWFAGSPGSRIYRSSDWGFTWQPAAVPATLPINRLCFVDEQSGWGVGARGLIVSTKNAGQTWKLQRGGTKRSALLGVFADERSIPWELLSQASAEQGYRVHIALLSKTVPQDPLLCELEKRLESAAALAGASAEVLTKVPFPVGVEPTATQLLSEWSKIDPLAVEKLSATLTRLIRVHRPNVVLTSMMGRRGTVSGAQQLTSRLLWDACEYSASENAYAQQLTELGLQPWTPSRTLELQPAQGEAVSLDGRETALGISVYDLARQSEQLVVGDHGWPPSQNWSLFSTDDDKQPTNFGRYPLSGLPVEYGSPARRNRLVGQSNVTRQRESISRRLRTKRIFNLERFVGSGQQRLEQLERQMGGDVEVIGDLLFDLAMSESGSGNDAEADRIFRHLITKYEQHRLSEQAFLWLVRHHTSLERQWREVARGETHDDSKLDDANVRLASAEEPTEFGDTESAAEVEENAAQDGEAVPRSVAGEEPFEQQLAVGFQLAREIKSKRPTLYHEPSVLFPLAAISRLDGQSNSAQSFYRRLTSLPDGTGWRHHALVELGLLGGKLSQTESVWSCLRVATRPHLDGILDDDCWQQTTAQALDGSSDNAHTQVVMGHDDEFLYVAAYCPKRQLVTYLPQRLPRPRDADLSRMDRIQIMLDVNRDYASWWHIEVDHRGWTREALMSDNRWNPTYYVATQADARSWSLELAIPLEELAPAQFRKGHWAVGVHRIVPEVQVESWNSATRTAAPAKLQGIMHLR